MEFYGPFSGDASSAHEKLRMHIRYRPDCIVMREVENRSGLPDKWSREMLVYMVGAYGNVTGNVKFTIRNHGYCFDAGRKTGRKLGFSLVTELSEDGLRDKANELIRFLNLESIAA